MLLAHLTPSLPSSGGAIPSDSHLGVEALRPAPELSATLTPFPHVSNQNSLFHLLFLLSQFCLVYFGSSGDFLGLFTLQPTSRGVGQIRFREAEAWTLWADRNRNYPLFSAQLDVKLQQSFISRTRWGRGEVSKFLGGRETHIHTPTHLKCPFTGVPPPLLRIPLTIVLSSSCLLSAP